MFLAESKGVQRKLENANRSDNWQKQTCMRIDSTKASVDGIDAK